MDFPVVWTSDHGVLSTYVLSILYHKYCQHEDVCTSEVEAILGICNTVWQEVNIKSIQGNFFEESKIVL
jgi:hypothetical protein